MTICVIKLFLDVYIDLWLINICTCTKCGALTPNWLKGTRTPSAKVFHNWCSSLMSLTLTLISALNHGLNMPQYIPHTNTRTHLHNGPVVSHGRSRYLQRHLCQFGCTLLSWHGNISCTAVMRQQSRRRTVWPSFFHSYTYEEKAGVSSCEISGNLGQKSEHQVVRGTEYIADATDELCDRHDRARYAHAHAQAGTRVSRYPHPRLLCVGSCCSPARPQEKVLFSLASMSLPICSNICYLTCAYV